MPGTPTSKRTPVVESVPSTVGRQPEQRLIDLAARLARTVALARALLQNGRRLDLTGVDDGVGILCAQTLDLPPESARAMLPNLLQVLTQVDLLAQGLHPVSKPDWRAS